MRLYECCSACPIQDCPKDCDVKHIVPCGQCASGAQPRVEISLQRRALGAFGPRAQLLALAEELAEAAAACVRLANDKGSARDVVEELVDVESVTESLRDYLASADEWASMRAAKARKLEQIIQQASKMQTRSTP